MSAQKLLIARAGVLLVTLLANLSAQNAPSVPPLILGTWRLNVAKSYWSGAIRASKAETQVASLDEGRLRVVSDRTSSDDRIIHSEWIGTLDGRDYPAGGEGQTRAITLINDFAYDAISKTNGAVTSTSHVVFSVDGKTKTVIETAKTSASAKVYDKQ